MLTLKMAQKGLKHGCINPVILSLKSSCSPVERTVSSHFRKVITAIRPSTPSSFRAQNKPKLTSPDINQYIYKPFIIQLYLISYGIKN